MNPRLYQWAKCSLPTFEVNTGDEISIVKGEYIARMVTKGGITEAIVNSLKTGETFETTLHRGIVRTREISHKIYELILSEDDFEKKL